MLTFTLTNGQEFKARFAKLPAAFYQKIRAKIFVLTLKLEAKVKNDKLSGQVLNHRSGNLWRSIKNRVADSGDSVEGVVFSDGSVKYAAIHEFGFDGIENVKAHVRNLASGKQAMVRAHERHMVMPERSFLRSSLSDMKADIIRGLQDAAREGLDA